MKNINTISPGLRDDLLNQNIGKYNQINEKMIYPIGTYHDIYTNVEIKKDSVTPNGLLDYVNNIISFDRKGEFEEEINMPYFKNRDSISIDLGYDSTVLPQYTYLEDETYYDPKDKNWLSMGVDAALGYVMGDSIGLSSTSEGFEVTSTSLESSTSLIGRLVESVLTNDSKLGKIGLTSLGTSLANSVIQKTRISEGVNKFFEKPIGFYDAVDTLDFDKMGNINIPKGLLNFSQNMLPLYFYTEVKKSSVKDFSWLNEGEVILSDSEFVTVSKFDNKLANENNTLTSISDFNLPTQSLLSKTQKLFQNGKIQTLVSKIGTDKIDGDSNVTTDNPMTKGRFLKSVNNKDYSRVWTATNQYNKISSLIKPFSDENKEKLKNDLKRVRPNSDSTSSLEKYGVLQNDGFVKIAPYKDDKFGKNDIKKYMFSIENLAWKDSIDSLINETSQEGPNGGRIMWFPPYDIRFNETTSVNWNTDSFIGRGEPVYTYTNTERNGTLSFKVIVDHPSIINYYKQADDANGNKLLTENDYLRFFAGEDVVKLPDEIIQADEPVIPPTPVQTPVTRNIKFKVFFPNNYSGTKDGFEDAMKYLYQGHRCTSERMTGYSNGYEMEEGKWKGLTDTGMTVGCAFETDANKEPIEEDRVAYFYRADSYQHVTDNQKKDMASYGLNSKKFEQSDPDFFSFKEAYEYITYPSSTNEENEELVSKTTRIDYVESYVNTNDLESEKILLKANDDIARINGNESERVGTGGTINLYNNALLDYTTAFESLPPYEKDYINSNPNGWISSFELVNINTKIGQPGSTSNNDLVNLKSKWDSYNEILTDYNNKLVIYATSKLDYYTSGTTTLQEFQEITNTYNLSKMKLDVCRTDLLTQCEKFLNTAPSYKSYNDFFQTLIDAKNITIMGSASKQGKESQNTILADNRSKIVKEWLSKYNSSAKYDTPSVYSDAETQENKDTSSKSAKLDRFAYVIITTKSESINTEAEAKKIGYTTGEKQVETKSETTVTAKRLKKSFYNYYYDKNGTNLRNDESQFFEKIGTSNDKKVIFDKLSEKIKYFSPAFHSMTPEGFNTRLTFLHQCTRQGSTSEATNSNAGKRSANNMAFGRPPICVLRIGDFYHTKVAFDSLNIDFDPLVWDLNEEGIGVQPMIANITLNFKFIGGSDLTGPIARLQNAVTFNFFANTGVYDDRNDRITKHEYDPSTKKYSDTYDTLYVPGIYDEGVKTIVDTSNETTNGITK